MDIYEIKVLLAVHVGNEELVLKNAGGKKLAGSNDYFVVTDDGSCYLFDANGTEKDISAITTLTEDIVSQDIKKIVVPDGITSIGDYAFYSCSSLKNVTIPNSVTSVKGGAFSRCISLKSVTIPDSVTSIGYRAFAVCRDLTSVMIPDSVTSIGERAFADCSGLTSVTIPNSVMNIGYRAFAVCNSLTSVIFKSKTFEEVQLMENYPFGIEDMSIIKCIDETYAVA